MTVNRRTKVFSVAMLLVLVLSIGSVVQAGGSPCCNSGPCTGSPGYWKNHPDAWPDYVWVGGVRYWKYDAIAIMDSPVRNDKSITMFKSVVAAKLNKYVNHCCSECIDSWIDEGNRWLHRFPPGSGIKAKTNAWQYCHGEEIYRWLDAYNNGKLCAEARN